MSKMSKIIAEFCQELCECDLKRKLRIAFERTLKYNIKENVAEILDLKQDTIDEFKTLFESIVDDCNYKFNYKEFCSSYYKKLHHYTFTNNNLDFLESTLDIKIDDIINKICSNETVAKEMIRKEQCSVIYDSELSKLDSIVTKTVREILDITSKVQVDIVVADFATEFKDYYVSYYKLLLNHNNKNISMFTIDTLNKAIKERLLKKDNIDKFRVKSKYCTNIDDIIQKEVIDKINDIDLNNEVNKEILKVIGGGVLPWDTELENFTNIHLELEDIRSDFECIERVFAREFQEYLFTFFLEFHSGGTSPTHIEYVRSEEACIAAMEEKIAAMKEKDYYLDRIILVNG